MYNFDWGTRAVFLAILVFCCIVTWMSVPPKGENVRPLSRDTWVTKKIFRSKTFWLQSIAMCFVYAGILGIPIYTQLWSIRRGLSIPDEKIGEHVRLTADSDVVFTVISNASQLVGRWVSVGMSDR